MQIASAPGYLPNKKIVTMFVTPRQPISQKKSRTMKITIEIDDDDRFDSEAQNTPWTLRMTSDRTGDELLEIGSEAAIIGKDLPNMLRELADSWPAGPRQHDPTLTTVTLEIENAYADETVLNIYSDVIVPTPTEDDFADLDEWSAENLVPFTGTGEHRSGDDSYYTITITHSTLAKLIGHTYEISG